MRAFSGRKPTDFGPRPRRDATTTPRRRSLVEESMRETERVRRLAWRLLRRLQAVAWWRGVMTIYPGGVVPVGTAGRVLGITRRRMNELVRDGRVPLVAGMPGGGRRDRFVPLDALIGAVSALEPGRRRGWCAVQARGGCGQPDRNPWLRVLAAHDYPVFSCDSIEIVASSDEAIFLRVSRAQHLDARQLTLWEDHRHTTS